MKKLLSNFLLATGIAVVVLVSGCEKENITTNETGTFTDTRDGKVYKTVKIGSQIWMAENLAFDAGIGTYGRGYEDRWGYLYTWEVAKSAVPDGWHLATKAEWDELIMDLGGVDAAADKMKDIASGDWTNQDIPDANSSGFSALPAGRYGYGTSGYDNRNQFGFWWTDEEFTNDMAWHYYIGTSPVGVDKEFQTKGLSVRCVKN